jgi:hypothetical protein
VEQWLCDTNSLSSHQGEEKKDITMGAEDCIFQTLIDRRSTLLYEILLRSLFLVGKEKPITTK